MKECSLRGVYVHCYAHILNLALQDTMSDVEPLRNALGTLQSLYNFLEGSPKRHAVFNSVKVDDDHLLRTLKPLSERDMALQIGSSKSSLRTNGKNYQSTSNIFK